MISAVDFTTDNYLIENTYVDIIPQLPYFTVRGGNIYSKNSLVSILPEREEYFAKENEPIIFIGGGVTEFGMGESAPQKRLLNGYNVDTKFEGSFFNYYSKLTESLASETVNDDDILRPLSANLKIVRYEPPSISPSRVLNYNRSGILNRDMVVFVQGDLYITRDIRIQEGNLAAFIVSGNIYIDQNVENIEGIFCL
ncbi:MAG: hypothetical protein KatS3mg087_0374 [Patescibacteria group bacterium]|nr:MAG: hypothetical protein KatS3mg087_0374 [Patescibacteria group bacterium]